MNFNDITGQPVSERDIQEAIDAVRKAMTVDILKLPPELGVQMANIHRCLKELQTIRQARP